MPELHELSNHGLEMRVFHAEKKMNEYAGLILSHHHYNDVEKEDHILSFRYYFKKRKDAISVLNMRGCKDIDPWIESRPVHTTIVLTKLNLLKEV